MHVLSACISSPCVCTLNVYVPSISIFLCLIVSSFVYRLDVYVRPCVRPSFYMSPSCVCPSVCMSPPCVCSLFDLYISLCVYISPCACSFRVYFPPCVCPLCVFFPPCVRPLRVYVSSVCAPSVYMSPPYVCFLRVYQYIPLYNCCWDSNSNNRLMRQFSGVHRFTSVPTLV